MSYFDEENNELMVAVLSNNEYPCLPLYECIENDDIVKEINNVVIRINKEKIKTQNMVTRLLDIIEQLERENNDLCKQNSDLMKLKE